MDFINAQLLPFIYIFSGGVFTLLFKIVFDWLKKQKLGNDGSARILMKCPLDKAEAISDIKWLRQVHSKTDKDGAFIWYFPSRLVKAMERVADETAQQNLTLVSISGYLRSNGDKLDTLIRNGKG